MDSQEYKIYIMLTKTGTILSKAIGLYTGKPYSHVSISLDIDLKEVYSFGRYNPRNPIFAGFIKEEVNKHGTYGRFPNTRCSIYSLSISKKQYRIILNEINKFKLEKDKYKYSILGLIGVVLDRPIKREYRYFCSQFVSEVLENSGLHLIEKEPELVTPDDFRQCKELELVYSGKLNDFVDLV